MDTGLEGDHIYLFCSPDGVRELFLHTVVCLVFRRVIHFQQLGVSPLASKDLLLLVNMDGAFGAVDPYLISS